MDKLIKKHKTFLVKKQNKLKKKFKLDCSTIYTINNSSLLAKNKYENLMDCNYHIIGTYNNNSCIWRWAWSNSNIPCKLSKLSKNSIEFGDKFNNKDFYNSKVGGKTKLFNFLVVVSMYDSKIDGYLIYIRNIDFR